ncbi:hypothetical protein GcM1_158005 [Golovinomyces cichoracearum]|uniref:Csep0475 effector protein n=1 Tax=Golovinomyces cichoracearum TaxID=62708 RepID=A0A420J9S1_9PEZI|nr:hypothetical protein GcM1_158005 [Golovinomyces cichoracearum]
MHFILSAKIAFVFIASAIAVPAISTAERSRLENFDKRSPQDTAPPAPGPVPTIPDNLSSFTCNTPDAAKDVTFPAQSLKDSLAKACTQKSNPINGFPKEFVPASTEGFANSVGPFFIMPINENNDPDTFVVMNSECFLATLVTKRAALVRARALFFKSKNKASKVNPSSANRTPLQINKTATSKRTRKPTERNNNAKSVRTRTGTQIAKRDLDTNDLEVCAATTI